ncbi:hypothetical protein D3C81_1838330 [compost metagenome]
MQGVGGLFGTAQTVQQQHFVEGIDQRVYALAEHGRAAGQASGDELGNGDGEVACQCSIDDQA